MWEEAADAPWNKGNSINIIMDLTHGKTIMGNLKLIQHFELEFHSRCPCTQLCI